MPLSKPTIIQETADTGRYRVLSSGYLQELRLQRFIIDAVFYGVTKLVSKLTIINLVAVPMKVTVIVILGYVS